MTHLLLEADLASRESKSTPSVPYVLWRLSHNSSVCMNYHERIF